MKSQTPSEKTISSDGGIEESPARVDVSTFPDGGLRAWVQVAGSFMIYFNIWGMANTYGVYQQFYQSTYIPRESTSNISWIGSLQVGLLVGCAIVTGPLLDRGYVQEMLVVGSFFIVFGMMMTSIATQFWQLLLAQGVAVGLGNGLLFVPSITIVPTYFKRRRSLAIGIVVSGSGVGAIIYSIIFHRLEPSIGFGWTNRLIALIMLTTQFLPIIAMKSRIEPIKNCKMLDMSAIHEAPLIYYSLSLFFAFLGIYVPFFHLQTQAAMQGIVTGYLNFYIAAFLNAGSFFGRLVPNIAADYIGPMNVVMPCTILTFILAFVWVGIHSTAGIILFAILYGFFSGTFLGLYLPMLAALSPNIRLLGTRMSMTCVPIATGLLIGNPIAGLLVDKSGYASLQVFCGVCIAVAIVFLVLTRISHAGWTIMMKV